MFHEPAAAFVELPFHFRPLAELLNQYFFDEVPPQFANTDTNLGRDFLESSRVDRGHGADGIEPPQPFHDRTSSGPVTTLAARDQILAIGKNVAHVQYVAAPEVPAPAARAVQIGKVGNPGA